MPFLFFACALGKRAAAAAYCLGARHDTNASVKPAAPCMSDDQRGCLSSEPRKRRQRRSPMRSGNSPCSERRRVRCGDGGNETGRRRCAAAVRHPPGSPNVQSALCAAASADPECRCLYPIHLLTTATLCSDVQLVHCATSAEHTVHDAEERQPYCACCGRSQQQQQQ